MTITGIGYTPPGTVQQQVYIPRSDIAGNHPHAVDFYVPRGNPKHAIISLHGGGGTKRAQAVMARTLKTRNAIVTPEDVNWSRLEYWSVIEVYPLGQMCLPSNAVDNPYNPNGVDSRVAKRPNGVTCWSNGYMWSGANDEQMLVDLKAYILATYPTVEKVHIHGHSNGGMMAKYMWRFRPIFDHYATTSGPTAQYWDATPFAPATAGPMWMQVGRKDTILGILDGNAGAGDHWADANWNQQIEQISVINVKGVMVGSTWVPQLQNTIPEWREIQRGIDAWNTANTWPAETWLEGDGAVTAAKTGTLKTWQYSNKRMILRLLSNADHSYSGQQLEQLDAQGRPVSTMSEIMKWITVTPTV